MPIVIDVNDIMEEIFQLDISEEDIDMISAINNIQDKYKEKLFNPIISMKNTYKHKQLSMFCRTTYKDEVKINHLFFTWEEGTDPIISYIADIKYNKQFPWLITMINNLINNYDGDEE